MDIKDYPADYKNIGFQSTKIAEAIDLIKKMREEKVTVFLSFTSNMVASGLRGIFKEMCRKKLVDVIITAGGSIDHDLIKTYLPYRIGDFSMDDKKLHEKGTNRIGNILVENKCYEELEKRMEILPLKKDNVKIAGKSSEETKRSGGKK